MTRLLLLMQSHWLTVALLAVSLGLLLRVLRRRQFAVSGWLAVGFMTFACGTEALSGWKYQLVEEGHTRTVAVGVVILSAVLLALVALLLLLSRLWSFWLVTVLVVAFVAGSGGWFGKELSAGIAYAGRSLLFLDFISPWWLVLLVFVPVVYLMSRGSLSGLGPWRKRFAVAGRMAVVACVALALAEPRILRPGDHVTVLYIVDRSFSVPQEVVENASGQPVDLRWQRVTSLIQNSVNKQYGRNVNDRFGVMLFGKRPKLLLPPAPVMPLAGVGSKTEVARRESARLFDPNAAGPVDGEYTDISSAFKLALASFPEGTGKRIVLLSDGNPNRGQLAEQIDLAVKNKVEVDTIALAPGIRNENEVRVESVDAPTLTAEGERRTLRVVVRNEHPSREVDGTLELIRVGAGGGADPNRRDPVEIVPTELVLDAKKSPPIVRLMPSKQRQNVFEFVDTPAKGRTSYTYTASFTPVRSRETAVAPWTPGLPGDRPANNAAGTVVVAKGKQKLLFINHAPRDNEPDPHRALVNSLRKSGLVVDELLVSALPAKRDQLALFLLDYDCIVLANVAVDEFTNLDHLEVIRQQVHDHGCGLVMVGGPDSYGPGGYQGTPVEAALPVDCEVKAKKAAGKGGLILIMHASEMADGNKWQKDIAKLAVQRLGPGDMIGILDYGFGVGGGVNWPIKFQEVGEDKSVHYAAIDRMTPGDMPDFDPFLKAAADTLSDPKHNLAVKHVILISDGDPQYSPVGMAAVKQMSDNNITCTTIGVATHGVNEDKKMQQIAFGTKDGNGKPGNFHKPQSGRDLPAIYIRETRKISQSFIYDKKFPPQLRLRDGPTANLPNELPELGGMVRTTKKESVLADMLIEGPEDPQSGQRFPVLAKWRYGLGKAVAFTSDARTYGKTLGWDQEWARADIYTKFWTDTVRWAMRDEEKGQLLVATENRNGRVQVTVSAQRTDPRDNRRKPMSGLSLQGMVSLPNPPMPGQPPPKLDFKPKAGSPGVYVAEFTADDAGSYFVTVNATEPKLGANGAQIRDPKGRQVFAPFDSARTGTTVPYSPEYADLETDTGRMKQIAEATGGRYHEEPITDAEVATLADKGEFFRKPRQSSESQTPFWYWLVFAAGLVLLFDVAVRRISFEWVETRTALAGVWQRLRTMPEAAELDEGSMIGALGRVKKRTADVEAKRKAVRRFEPGEGESIAPAGADDFGTSGPTAPPPPPTAKSASPVEAEDDFMARMKKARDRGRRGPDQT